MHASPVLLLLAATACQSSPITAPQVVEPAPAGARGSSRFEEVLRDAPSAKGAKLGRVVLVRADPSDPLIQYFTPEGQGKTPFDGLLQDPARSVPGNLGRVKLIRADSRDPFIRYFEGSR